MVDLIWIQTVSHTDGIPEIFFFSKKLILKKQQTAKTLPNRQRIKMKWHITNLLPEIMISKNRHFKTQNYR